MTKTEMADLEIAIGLINDLRVEIQSNFQSVSKSLEKVSEAQATHVAVHEERDRVRVQAGVTKRWVIQVAAATAVSIVVGLGTLILGVVKLLSA